jgi:endonuclease-8
VHLGMYGAWDFAGDLVWDDTIASANGRMGQTNQRGTILDSAGENSMHSIGAPRRTRVRMAESETVRPTGASQDGADVDAFPPEPIGQVRARLLTATVCADLRGPTACQVIDAARVAEVIGRLGPDPLNDDPAESEERFTASVRKRSTPIGLLLMDQSVVSGIGNVYRAEMLYRARIDPHTPGKLVTEEAVRGLWRDWVHLLRIGVETGQMMTMDGLDADSYRDAMANRSDRHWVYKREGLPCRVCGTNIVLEEMGARKLYWCPRCQSTSSRRKKRS